MGAPAMVQRGEVTDQLELFALSTMVFVLLTSLLLLPFLRSQGPEFYIALLTILMALSFVAYLAWKIRRKL